MKNNIRNYFLIIVYYLDQTIMKKQFRMAQGLPAAPESAYKLPAPEEWEICKDYAFTFNPQTQPDISPTGRVMLHTFRTFVNEIYDFFLELKHCHVSCYWEISKKGRWHLHGYIQIRSKSDVLPFYNLDLKLLMNRGMFDIEPIPEGKNKDGILNSQAWSDYIEKQQELMLQYSDLHGFRRCLETGIYLEQ